TYRRKYTDSSSRYYTEISYTVNDNNTVVYSTTDPSQESYYVTPVNGSWQTEGAYIDMTDKVIEVPVNAENFTMVLKSTYGATHWSQNAIFVDWNNNGSFVDAGETNGVINISNKPNTAQGGLVAKGGDTDVIALPEGLKAGDTFTLLIAMNEPKGVDGTQDLWGTDWEWTTEIFNDNVCSLINGQAYALTVKITEASAPTVVSTKDYVGLLTVQIGEDGEASDIEDTTVHFSTMSDGTYSLLLENFGADPSDPDSEGFGDIQIDGITRDGDNLSGFAPMLELMGGAIKANAALTGEFEGEDITLHLDVNWLDEDGVTVLAPIYVDFTTKKKPAAPTVVSTRDYVGLLTVQIGEDGDASDIEDTTVHFSTMSDGTYSLLLRNFGADPSDPNDPGFGDIQIDGITLDGTTLTGSAPMLELMGGAIKAKADLEGELEGDDLTLHLDVFWLDEDGVTVLAPIYVDFTTIVEPGSIGSIDADNNAPVEYYTIQGVRVSGDNLT
ncbi:MAG: calycin-like domain-containing protein, partial [Paramuribaculum sp.]|nr:calycin-like domain-containing protein [Paramuribaculum sp.]